MGGYENSSSNENVHTQNTFLSSTSLRNSFLEWLSEGHSNEYLPTIMINCLDSISEYALQKKICSVDIWSISQDSIFQSVYSRILEDIRLRITNKEIYKLFRIAGQLYLVFLKECASRKDLLNGLTSAKYATRLILQDMTVITSSEKHHNGTALVVDFTRPELCAQTRPVSCLINGRAVVPDKQNWSRLLVAITERFIEENNPNLNELDKKSLYGNRPFFMPYKADVGNCSKLSNGKWIYTNYNPQAIVKIIGNLCRHCGVSLSDVVIRCMPKNAHLEYSPETFADRAKKDLLVNNSSNIVVEPAFAQMITEIMSTHFPNGFRIDSPIELLRFRRFAAEDFANEILISDEELIKAISSCGIILNGKVYVISNEVKSRIKDNIDLAVSNSVEIIYYSSFYKIHEEWLLAGGVISEEMLKEILSKMYPKYMCKAKYFSSQIGNGAEITKIKREILRVWGSDVTLNYEQLAECLPYIPIEKIKSVLAQNSEFIWNSPGVYTHISKVDVSKEEIIAISDYVNASCQKNSYVSLNDIPLDGVADRNYELSLTAIHNAVFEIVLSSKYYKRGKIITRIGNDTFDALTIMKEYCRKLDKCTLQDLFDFERELTGELHYWIPMEAAYSVMVRVDKNSYVAEKYVYFDVGGIDSILDLLVTGEYLPLKSVTTFAAFPYCGQAWSLFLLESYCRRFSDKYRFEVLSVNSKNVGVIVRKSCRMSYLQIMADAVAKSGIPLEKEVIEEFLYNSGYLGRRSYSKINELIEQAKAIRERMD